MYRWWSAEAFWKLLVKDGVLRYEDVDRDVKMNIELT
jgi:hypothetical protein